MAYAATLPTATNAAMQQLLDNDNALLICQAGNSSPATPAAGTLWFDTNTGINKLKVYNGSAWVIVADVQGSKIVNANDYEFSQLRLENLTSSLTPAAGNIGRIMYHTNEQAVQLVKTDAILGRIMVGDTSQYIVVNKSINEWTVDGTTPPTPNTRGTSPAAPGLLFDAAGEKMSCGVYVPEGFSEANDAKLRLFCWLEATETAGDDADFQANWVSCAPSSANTVDGTSSNATAAKDLGSTVAAGSTFVMDITLPYNDATNPLLKNDHLIVDLLRNGLAEVAGINVWHTQFLFPFAGTVLEI